MSEGFTVNDKRKRTSGLITNQTVAQAKTQQQAADAAVALGRTGRAPTDFTQVKHMKSARRKTALAGAGSAGSGSSISVATNRPHDPMFYWKQNNLPYDASDPEQLIRLRDLCRLLYQTHPLLASAIDIFSRWPVVGMEMVGKDEELNSFYSELFIEQLDYESYLTDIGREYWTVGEAFPLGSFNEDLGVWENDELINPNEVFVENSPFLTESHFYIQLPETLREILRSGQPVAEYRQLITAYPELMEYKEQNARMPVSNMLMSHLRFKGNTFNPRGVPILLRGLRAVIQEEMLNAAQDAIADRLYTPLILARIGATAQELGTEEPWIPSDEQLADFEDAVDTALAADFRLLTTHFAVQMESVFGRENMPNLDNDFERLSERQLQVFGLSKSMLSGSSSGDTYASNALNRDLVSQLLQTYQKQLKKFVRQRMLIVAEAQEHFDYEEHNGQKRVIMEEVLVRDPESGKQKVVERPKLLVPELRLRCLAYGTQVQTPDGPVATETLVVGDEVLAWDTDSQQVITSTIEMSQDNGVQPLYRIETKLGRIIEATDEHPFWSNSGWVQAKDLVEGDAVRVGTDYKPQPSGDISERDAYFIGLMVGDGGVTGNDVRLSSTDTEVTDWVRQYLSGWGCEPVQVDSRGVDWRLCQKPGRRMNPNPVKQHLQDWGVWGHNAHTKRVPSVVWSAGQHCWAAFLSGYLDADGSVAQDVRTVWYSRNRPLLEDCQSMLAFLGIRSDLCDYMSGEGGITGQFIPSAMTHSLVVSTRQGRADLQRLLEPRISRKQGISTDLGTVDKRRSVTPEQAREIKALVAAKKETYRQIGSRYGISASSVMRAVQGVYDDLYSAWVDPAWDEVKSVELLAAKPTWSLTVHGSHTHVTAGLISHNTMNLSDESTEREFLEALRASGVPISQRTRSANAGLDLEEEIEISTDEQVAQAVAAEKVRRETYRSLREENLPIPDDLAKDFGPTMVKADDPEDTGDSKPGAPAEGVPAPRLPQLGVDDQPHTALAPTPEELMMPADPTPGEPDPPATPAPGAPAPAAAPAPGKLPTNKSMNRPPESDEMRAKMPKPTAATVSKTSTVDGVEVTEEISVTGALIAGPSHMGRQRRYTRDRPDLSAPSR